MRSLFGGIAALAAASLAQPAMAEPGDILIKLRGGYVLHAGSDAITVDIDGTTVTAKPKGAAGGEASLTFFLTDHIATELGFGGSSYDLKDASGRTLSSGGMITPTLLLQYHLLPQSPRFRPYIGAGLAYANFYSEKPGAILTDRATPFRLPSSTSLEGMIAPVAQVGADIAVNEKLYLNIDAKYLGGKSKFKLDDGATRQTLTHKTRSIILSAGVGVRF